MVDGDKEIVLRREEFTLRGKGWIAFDNRSRLRRHPRVLLRMSARRLLGATVLGCAMLGAFGLPFPAQGSKPRRSPRMRYARGIRSRVARKTRYEGVTLNQMIVAIWRATRARFQAATFTCWKWNSSRYSAATLLRRSSPRGGPAGPGTARGTAPGGTRWRSQAAASHRGARKARTGAPRAEQAARRYKEGLAMERRGDQKGRLRPSWRRARRVTALAAAQAWRDLRQGNSATPRDYQTSLKWYQKAREQGVEIPKPIQRGPIH